MRSITFTSWSLVCNQKYLLRILVLLIGLDVLLLTLHYNFQRTKRRLYLGPQELHHAVSMP